MATRSRVTPGRSSKKTPPLSLAGSEEKKKNAHSASPAGADSARKSRRTQTAEITKATLERRDIPSFSDSREQRVAEAAYWRAERRGFEPGYELDDWLAAEREIDKR